MMRRTSLKLLGLLLAVLMTVGLLPLGSMSAQAEEPETEIPSAGLEIRGAIYDIRSGEVSWL